jgi:7-cyano-7-deazaguanine synthase
LASLYLSDGWSVRALFVDYGQAARAEEWQAAMSVGSVLGVQVESVSNSGVRTAPSGQALPGRNALLLLTALARFGSSVDVVSIGIHGGSPYWDCSPEFLATVQALFDGYTLGLVRVGAPFVAWTKREIYTFARATGTPVGVTYSCDYSNGPCGSCGSCRDVAAALA